MNVTEQNKTEVTIVTIDDMIPEGEEEFNLVLQVSPTSGGISVVVGDRNNASFTIIDNDGELAVCRACLLSRIRAAHSGWMGCSEASVIQHSIHICEHLKGAKLHAELVCLIIMRFCTLYLNKGTVMCISRECHIIGRMLDYCSMHGMSEFLQYFLVH